MKILFVALRLTLFMTALTGLAYPLLTTLATGAAFSQSASGSPLFRQSAGPTNARNETSREPIGSEWVGQKFESSRYFWGRPSAVDYNPVPSGGSNLSPASRALQELVKSRSEKLSAMNSRVLPVPLELVTASASGLDPHISPEGANYQVERVARERGLSISAVRHVVNELTEQRQFGILGDQRVNVLKLNLAIDDLSSKQTSN